MSQTLDQAYSSMVQLLAKNPEAIVEHLVNNPAKAHLWHMGTGVSGESGELLDAIKKHVIYGKDADVKNIVEELGDLEFYMEGIRQHFQITREETLKANMDKLHTGAAARYRSGYSDEAAQLRSDKQVTENQNDALAKRQIVAFYVPSLVSYFTYSLDMGANDYALYWSSKRNSWNTSASVNNSHLHSRKFPDMVIAHISSEGIPYVPKNK